MQPDIVGPVSLVKVNDSNSISRWIDLLKDGDRTAAGELWSRYVARLIRVAHARLSRAPKRVADEDDVVNRAFEAFLRGVELGRFSRLEDRHDLWQILVMLTERQATDQIRAEQAQKRGNGKVRGHSIFANEDDLGDGFDRMQDASPSPEFALQASEELRKLLDELDDEALCGIALQKLEGYSNREIAEKIGKSECTVERKLGIIRKIWRSRPDDDDSLGLCVPA